jgi:hypothetical protein
LEDDIPMFAVQLAGDQFFGHEPVEHTTRAFGAGARHMLEATIALSIEAFGNVARDRELANTEQAQFAYGLLKTLLAATPALLAQIAQHTMDFAAAVPPSGRAESQLAVVFCDLADSTRSAVSRPVEMARAIRELELHASHVVVDHGGRVVNFVGDEVLFVNTGENAAIQTAVS